MIRSFLLLFFFAIAPFSYGQKELKLDSTLRSAYLARIFPLDNFCVHIFSDEDTIQSFLNFHDEKFSFYKAISTNDTMVVFDGKLCGGYESGVVDLYRITKGIPKRILSRSGKIADIRGDELWIHKYPCCAEILNIITPYSLSTGARIGGSHVFYSREGFEKVFPSISAKNGSKVRLNKDAIVRWSASTTDHPEVPACDHNYTNIIDTLSKGQVGHFIMESEGGWVLLRFDSMPTPDGYCMNNYYQKLIDAAEYSLYGWVEASCVDYE